MLIQLVSKMTILLCSAETVDARPTQIWLKDTSTRSSTAVEFQTLTHSCGNSVPNQFFQPCHLFGHCSHLTVM